MCCALQNTRKNGMYEKRSVQKYMRFSIIWKSMHIDEDVFYFLHLLGDFGTLVILIWNDFLILHELFHNHTYHVNIYEKSKYVFVLFQLILKLTYSIPDNQP